MPVPLLRALPVVETVDRGDALPNVTKPYAHDTITLGWEERVRARARRRSDGGLEFATALPRGTVLRESDCLIVTARKTVVRVIELPEAVLVVRPPTPEAWGLFAYQIGNSHQPIMLTSDAIVCPDVLGMEQVLSYHGIPFVREERPFTPLGQLSSHAHVPR